MAASGALVVGVVKMMKGDLRPAPSEELLRPAALTIRLPVAVEPVKEIERTSGWLTSGSPAVSPKPCTTTLKTPGGMPASRPARPGGEGGRRSDIFITAVLPKAWADAVFQVAVMKGVPQRSARTRHRLPQGVVQVASVSGRRFRRACAGSARRNGKLLSGRGDQHALGLVGDLAAVGGLRSAISATLAAIRSPSLRTRRARSLTGVAASREGGMAAATAALISASPPLATSAITSPVAD